MRMRYYDSMRGRYRIKRRYSFAAYGFATGIALGLLIAVLM